MVYTIISTIIVLISISVFSIFKIKKMEDKKMKDKKIFIELIIAADVFTVLISALFFLLLYKNYINPKYNDYLAFEGSIITSVVALIGVVFTLAKTHEENEIRNAIERENNEAKLRAEAEPMLLYKFERVTDLPLFDIRIYDKVDFSIEEGKKTSHIARLTVECLGKNPAKKLRLQSATIKPKKEVHYSRKWKQFLLPQNTEELYIEEYILPTLKTIDDCHRTDRIEIKFKVCYSDIYDNEYAQTVSARIYPVMKKYNNGELKPVYVYEIEDLKKAKLIHKASEQQTTES